MFHCTNFLLTNMSMTKSKDPLSTPKDFWSLFFRQQKQVQVRNLNLSYLAELCQIQFNSDRDKRNHKRLGVGNLTEKKNQRPEPRKQPYLLRFLWRDKVQKKWFTSDSLNYQLNPWSYLWLNKVHFWKGKELLTNIISLQQCLIFTSHRKTKTIKRGQEK